MCNIVSPCDVSSYVSICLSGAPALGSTLDSHHPFILTLLQLHQQSFSIYLQLAFWKLIFRNRTISLHPPIMSGMAHLLHGANLLRHCFTSFVLPCKCQAHFMLFWQTFHLFCSTLHLFQIALELFWAAVQLLGGCVALLVDVCLDVLMHFQHMLPSSPWTCSITPIMALVQGWLPLVLDSLYNHWGYPSPLSTSAPMFQQDFHSFSHASNMFQAASFQSVQPTSLIPHLITSFLYWNQYKHCTCCSSTCQTISCFCLVLFILCCVCLDIFLGRDVFLQKL